jgi:gluconolactonase
MRDISATLVKPMVLLCGFVIVSGFISELALAFQTEQSLVARHTRVIKLVGGFEFTEGPAVDADGNIFFSDIPNDKIYKWSVTEAKLSLFRENSDGANGLYFDKAGNIIACEGTTRRVSSISPDGDVSVLVDRYEGKRFNQPNDLWIDPAGGIYFTDPAYSMEETEIEQPCDGVYYIKPDRTETIRLVDYMNRPNGIVGANDGKHLYVTEHRGGKTWVFQIQSDGTLSGKKLFAELGSDGMTLDERGNVYLTNLGNESVDIYSPEGERLESIQVPERPANLCFGGPERRTLFITARTSLYSLDMLVRGQ